MTAIILTDTELQKCRTHSEAIVNHYGGQGSKGSGTYNHNSNAGNVVGVKCEVATARWLDNTVHNVRGAQVLRHYENFRHPKPSTVGKGDIQVKVATASAMDICIEVKGLQHKHWDRLQRMIPYSQIDKYVDNQALCVWATADANADDPSVTLHGWNWAHEVKDKGTVVRTICLNVWLHRNEDMHTMDELKELILQNHSFADDANVDDNRGAKRIKRDQ